MATQKTYSWYQVAKLDWKAEKEWAVLKLSMKEIHTDLDSGLTAYKSETTGRVLQEFASEIEARNYMYKLILG